MHCIHPGAGDVSTSKNNCSLKDGENLVGTEANNLELTLADVSTNFTGMHFIIFSFERSSRQEQ